MALQPQRRESKSLLSLFWSYLHDCNYISKLCQLLPTCLEKGYLFHLLHLAILYSGEGSVLRSHIQDLITINKILAVSFLSHLFHFSSLLFAQRIIHVFWTLTGPLIFILKINKIWSSHICPWKTGLPLSTRRLLREHWMDLWQISLCTSSSARGNTIVCWEDNAMVVELFCHPSKLRKLSALAWLIFKVYHLSGLYHSGTSFPIQDLDRL